MKKKPKLFHVLFSFMVSIFAILVISIVFEFITEKPWLIGIVFLVIVILITVKKGKGEEVMKDIKNLKLKLPFASFFGVIILAGFIILVFTNCYTVNTGEVAIISTWGKVTRIDAEGLHFKIPFVQSKTFMEIREKTYIFGKTEEMDTTMEVSTKDMQSILIDLTVQANITDPEKLYRAFHNKHEYRFVRPRVKEVVQATIAKYTIEEFVSKRAEISTIINKGVARDLAEYGMNVNNVSIVNHDFSDEYERAIEQKKVAEQAVETARAEQQKLLVEYENKVKVAELELKEREIRAKANTIESQTLTPQLLKKMAIEKWDGHLPKVQGNNISNLIPLEN